MVAIGQSVSPIGDYYPKISSSEGKLFTTAQKVTVVALLFMGLPAAVVTCVLGLAMPTTVVAIAIFSVVMAISILDDENRSVVVYQESGNRSDYGITTGFDVVDVPSYPVYCSTRARRYVEDGSRVRVGGGHERFVPVTHISGHHGPVIDPVRIVPPSRTTSFSSPTPGERVFPPSLRDRVEVGSRGGHVEVGSRAGHVVVGSR